MKYVITSIYYTKTGDIVFSSPDDIEVFDHFYTALRWILIERNLARKYGAEIILNWNKGRCPYGREWLLEMTENHGSSHSVITLSRINNNGNI